MLAAVEGDARVFWLPVAAPRRLPGAEPGRARRLRSDYQGVVAAVAPYPYADPNALLAREGVLLAALDEVTDPHNLGAVARVAECAGADGLLVTRRRSAAVTAAVCRASAGAVEHLAVARVENLAQTLLCAPSGRALELCRSRRRRRSLVRARDVPPRRRRVRARRRGSGVCVRACAAACDAVVSIPMLGRVESLNVSTAAAVLLFEAARQRRLADWVRSGSSTATTSRMRARGVGESTPRCARELVADVTDWAARLGMLWWCSCWTAKGADATIGPLRWWSTPAARRPIR